MAENYQVLEELGSGSFGVVYKAIEKSTGDLVAIKHIDLEGSDDDIREIEMEIALLSTCASQWVTQYKTSFVRGVKLWIVMEYLGGGSCLDLLKPGPFAEAHIAIICRELLFGLEYLHASGKIHRDIKAANILLSNKGRVKLADFGVAAQLTNIKSQRMTFVGTPFWMAPEVIQEVGYDHKADLWSLGITALEMANAEPPHADTHPMKVLFLIPKAPAPRLEGGNWSKDFRDFVAQCLIKDPDRRPTAKELLKHRFITRAGKVAGLRELIERRQMWDAGEDMHGHPRYYEETLNDMTPRAEKEEWVFDTIKQSTIAQAPRTHKRRKVSAVPYDETSESTEALMERLSLAEAPLGTGSPAPSPAPKVKLPPVRKTPTRRTRRRSSFATAVRVPSGATPTARRISGQVEHNHANQQPQHMQQAPLSKQPLALDLSFGNSPSTVRQFRRVSGEQAEQQLESHRSSLVGSPINLSHLPSRSHHQACPGDENMPPPPSLSRHDSSMSSAHTQLSQSAAQEPAQLATKDSLLGRRLFTKAIDPALQETHAQTGGPPSRREAVARVANALAELDQVDPAGTWALMRSFVEHAKADRVVAGRLGLGEVSNGTTRRERPRVDTTNGTPSASPTKQHHRRQESQPKLVLAQNNPHLKSHHRRRQSEIVLGSINSMADSGGSDDGRSRRGSAAMTGGLDPRKLPGYAPTGMEHVSQLADALYGRWIEGLGKRWGAA